MSKFSEKCKEIIRNENTNVYQISKKSGLERTTLQRMVNGERKVNRQFVEKLCDFLQVNKQDREELLELWNMEDIGEKLYYSRREIRKMLREIQQICTRYTQYQGGMYRIERRKSEEKFRVLNLEMDIADAIRYAVSEEIATQENPVIYMDYFKNATYAMQQMIREERENKKKIQCFQYVRLQLGSKETAIVENISKLKWILSFAFTFKNGYYPKYIYVNGGEEEEKLDLWPHFLFTTSKLILISADQEEALVITEPKMLAIWRGQLKKKQDMYTDLLSYHGGTKQKAGYEQYEISCKAPLYELTSHPSISMKVYGDGRVVFGYTADAKRYIYVCIEEKGIYEAFFDYLKSFPDSNIIPDTDCNAHP